MAYEIPLRCKCGAMSGVVHQESAGTGNRVLCYCDDCQAFAYYLERADEMLDPLGGSDIFQTTPSRLRIEHGHDQLACMRLRPGGLMRWHTRCCRTPVANTIGSAQVPFVGLVHPIMDHTTHGLSRDEALGPVRDRVFGRYARGGVGAPGAHAGGSPATLLRMVGRMTMDRLRGRHRPSPFFSASTGEPTVTPYVLSPEELEAVIAARDAG